MVDAVATVKSILTANWNASNTDSVTPIIDFIKHQKEIDLNNNDYLLLYLVNTIHAPFNIGGTTFSRNSTVTIDIRTTYKASAIADVDAHLQKVKEEVFRIAKLKLHQPDSDWKLLLLHEDRDLSDKNIGIGRMVIDVTLKKWGS